MAIVMTTVPALTAAQKKHIQLWIDALRSGEFEQTNGRLMREYEYEVPRYCCLGVACELYSQTVGGYWYDETFVADIDASDPYTMPLPVKQWFGLPDINNMDNSVLNHAIHMNDRSKSFDEIANYLEEALLFKKMSPTKW